MRDIHAALGLLTRHLRGMNSDLRLTVRPRSSAPVDRAASESALDACAVWLAAFERTCSRFLPDSELCALNASAGVPFSASPDLFAVVRLAMDFRERTGGLFDPTILPALRAAGYTRSFDEIAHTEVGPESTEPRRNALGARTGAGTDAEEGEQEWAGDRIRTVEHASVAAGDDSRSQCRHAGIVGRLHLDETTRSITLAPGVALDLGGIAKGWAADELAQRFMAPFPAYLIDLGGDLRVYAGPRDDDPWILGIADPRPNLTGSQPAESYVAGLALTAGGIATSGDVRRWWLHDGVRQHHLIDPRTAHPAAPSATNPDARVLTYTALAQTTAEADVLAKVAFLLGYPAGLRLLTHGIHSAGVAVFASGRVEATPNLEEYLYALPTPSAAAQ